MQGAGCRFVLAVSLCWRKDDRMVLPLCSACSSQHAAGMLHILCSEGVVPSLVMVSNPRRALGRTLTLPLTLAACVQRSGAASVRPGADSALRALGPLACARCAGAAACDRR